MTKAKAMSKARLQEIKGRLGAATPGPWVRRLGGEIGTVERISDKRAKVGYREKFTPCVLKKRDEGGLGGLTLADLDLMANAPQDIADLMAEVERLQGK